MNELTIETKNQFELLDITKNIQSLNVSDGLLLLSCPHTSCALFLGEFDDALKNDFEKWAHDTSGKENKKFKHIHIWDPSRTTSHSTQHFMAAMLGNQIVIEFENGKIQLGKFQRVIIMEFSGPRKRTILLKRLMEQKI